jgi:anthranilate synthase component I
MEVHAVSKTKVTLEPVIRELSADLETPVSVYLKVAGMGPSFLLESVTGGEQLARYSFIGIQPGQSFVFRDRSVEIHHHRGEHPHMQTHTLEAGQDPLSVLEGVLAQVDYQPRPGMPRFAGGLVGYLSYELTRFFEPSVHLAAHASLPEAIFLLADTLIAFDHAFGRLLLIGNLDPEGEGDLSRPAVEARLDEIERRLSQPLPERPGFAPEARQVGMQSNLTREEFTSAVLAAKEHIAAGDIFQVVLSQRLQRETQAAPFDIYRALRRLNPSPYMFFFDFSDLAGDPPLFLIGASPEMHVRLEERLASLRPIAGTRKRGVTEREDLELERELLADPKERAEHVMLVDLGRNDLGRICQIGSVRVSEKMVIERYSHVMHIVSHIEGVLGQGQNAFDLLRATFPAGTVSGAPKIRAMQIIHQLEKDPRGPYAGAVGYFSFDGSMDTCIAIRTMVMRGAEIQLQGGAGIVADSDPDLEYEETLNKLRALGMAIDMAEKKETLG